MGEGDPFVAIARVEGRINALDITLVSALKSIEDKLDALVDDRRELKARVAEIEARCNVLREDLTKLRWIGVVGAMIAGGSGGMVSDVLRAFLTP